MTHPCPLEAPNPDPLLDAYNDMASCRGLEDGWDGVESKSVSAKVVDMALEFLNLLPRDMKSPEASASEDGTVDWYWRSGDNAATVTFYEGGLIAYFVMGVDAGVKGSFEFNSAIPDELMEGLQRL